MLGVATNLGFLARVAAPTGNSPRARSIPVSSSAIGRLSCRRNARAPDVALAAAALVRLQARAAAASAAAAESGDPFSPWARTDGWRLGSNAAQEVVLRDGDEERVVAARREDRGWALQFGDRELVAGGERLPDGTFAVTLDGVRRQSLVLVHGPETAVFVDGESWRLVELDPLARGLRTTIPTAGRLTAPMPGRIIRLMVEAGEIVRRGEPLMIIEAMKMEHTVTAPVDGVVEAVRFAVGDLVEEGAELISLASEAQGRS